MTRKGGKVQQDNEGMKERERDDCIRIEAKRAVVTAKALFPLGFWYRTASPLPHSLASRETLERELKGEIKKKKHDMMKQNPNRR